MQPGAQADPETTLPDLSPIHISNNSCENGTNTSVRDQSDHYLEAVASSVRDDESDADDDSTDDESGGRNLSDRDVMVPTFTPALHPGNKASRIAQYEALACLPTYGTESGVGFMVSKTDWTGKAPKDSPLARYPNGIYKSIIFLKKNRTYPGLYFQTMD
jgi:hypothetical protein